MKAKVRQAPLAAPKATRVVNTNLRNQLKIGNFEIASPDIQKVSIPHKVAVSFSFLSKVHKEALLKRHDASK